jgi:hypothetical protein
MRMPARRVVSRLSAVMIQSPAALEFKYIEHGTNDMLSMLPEKSGFVSNQ